MVRLSGVRWRWRQGNAGASVLSARRQKEMKTDEKNRVPAQWVLVAYLVGAILGFVVGLDCAGVFL
jgi:hypothetical protein